MDPLIVAAFAVVIGLALALFVFCCWATYDVLARPARQWRGSDQNQTLWAVVVVGSWLFGLTPIAAALYWFIARPALKRVDGMRLAS
jgi:hypothetical protein